MGAIFQSVPRKIRVLRSEKTSFPLLRYAPSGTQPSSFAQGEWVGLGSGANGVEEATKITSSNEVAQAKNAILVHQHTTNDALESGAVGCRQGFFHLETTAYKSDDSYVVGQRLTVRYVAAFGGGVLAAANGGNTTHYVAQVIIPPSNASANTPMTVAVFATPVKE